MTTAIDTNIVVSLWDADPTLSASAQRALDKALAAGMMVIAGPVFSELMAAPGRSEAFVDSFLRETGISVDWELRENIWRAAGRAFQAYSRRRKLQRHPGPRRILADFLMGAHAQENGYILLTLDDQLYRSAFAGLRIETI